MNYRHAFHAGNFADIYKHAVLLNRLRQRREPQDKVLWLDTHAGAGLYDLSGAQAQRSNEARLGVGLLLDEQCDKALKPLSDYVRTKQVDDGMDIYPGSPILLADHRRPQDQYLACELRRDDFLSLKQSLSERSWLKGVSLREDDGYDVAIQTAKNLEAETLLFLLIDPPFERGDDYQRLIMTLKAVNEARNGKFEALIWIPLKDPETLDRFWRDLHTLGLTLATTIVVLQLRAMENPLMMNGCALVGIAMDEGWSAKAQDIGNAILQKRGEPGACVMVRHL
jgi:23S rRNA (adenine2030-N6)-methyltransferase